MTIFIVDINTIAPYHWSRTICQRLTCDFSISLNIIITNKQTSDHIRKNCTFYRSIDVDGKLWRGLMVCEKPRFPIPDHILFYGNLSDFPIYLRCASMSVVHRQRQQRIVACLPGRENRFDVASMQQCGHTIHGNQIAMQMRAIKRAGFMPFHSTL